MLTDEPTIPHELVVTSIPLSIPTQCALGFMRVSGAILRNLEYTSPEKKTLNFGLDSYKC